MKECKVAIKAFTCSSFFSYLHNIITFHNYYISQLIFCFFLKGKSLCYALPASMLPGLTLIVSPLISLMQDQLKKLPLELPGACFSGGMSAHQVSQLCVSVLQGHVKVLYVSPERLCTQSFRNLIRALRNQESQVQLYDPVRQFFHTFLSILISSWSHDTSGTPKWFLPY